VIGIFPVAQKLYSEEPSCGTYQIHTMSRDQAAMGHDVTVLTTRRDPPKPSVEQRHNYTLVRFNLIISPLGNDVSIRVAQYLTSDPEFDVVHTPHICTSPRMSQHSGDG
jgi:hypothetical protein